MIAHVYPAARPAEQPAIHNLDHCRGTGEIVPVVCRTFEWGVVIAPFLSVLSIVPHHCACLTYFLLLKLMKINVVLITPTPRRLQCALCAPHVLFCDLLWLVKVIFRQGGGNAGGGLHDPCLKLAASLSLTLG